MRQTIVRMASSLRPGQTLVGRTGTLYQLKKNIYERKIKDMGVEKVVRSVWLARSVQPHPQPY